VTEKTILMVSKPVVPPWNDSAKNLVRDVVRSATRHRFRVLVSKGVPFEAPRVSSAEIYAAPGQYTPALRQNARVLWHLLHARADVVHYFFAPNPRTSAIARVVGLARRWPSVQTVCSAPRDWSGAGRLLFADRVIVLSEDTHRKLARAGVAAERLRLIPPGIEPFAPLSPAERAAARRLFAELPEGDETPVILYPGDYQFSEAAFTVGSSVARVVATRPARFVFACRIKQEESRRGEDRVRQKVTQDGALAHVRFWNEVDDVRALLGAADLVVMPAESLYAKMDVPLVLLEAMSLGVPLVVANVPPLSELLGDDVGVGVAPRDAEAFAGAVQVLLADPARRAALGQRAREVIARRYSARTMASAYEDVYDEVGSGESVHRTVGR
jgi:phosphatidylinositol alpha-1,6-mannosyltransferase